MLKKKKCNKCGEEKWLSEFHKKSTNKDGLNTKCKKCQSIYVKEINRKRSNRTHIDIPETKICGHCKKNLPSSMFSKNRCMADGLCGYCKICDTKKAGKLRRKNINRDKKDIIIPDVKFCNRCETIKSNKHFMKNKSRKDGLNPYCNSCTSVIMVGQNKKRREFERGLPEKEFSPEDAKIVMNSCQRSCIMCDAEEDLCIDHFRPLSKGNALCIGNAIILCRSCNSKKHNKDPEDFFDEEILHYAYVAIAVSNIFKFGVG